MYRKPLIFLDVLAALITAFAIVSLPKIWLFLGTLTYANIPTLYSRHLYINILRLLAVIFVFLYIFLARPLAVKRDFSGANSAQARIFWSVLSALILWVLHIPFGEPFGWFFMSGWSYNLSVFGWIVIFFASFADFRNTKKILIAVISGYIGGFILSQLFNSDSFDPNARIYVNNAWAIWTFSYLICIAVAIAWCIIEPILQSIGGKK